MIPDTLYHYTTVSALNGILFGSEIPDQINLHFTHFQYLNDGMEVMYGLSTINRIVCKLMEEYHASYQTEEGQKYKEIAALDMLDKILNHLVIRLLDENIAKGFLEDYKKRNPRRSNGFAQLDTAFRDHRSAIFVGSFAKSHSNSVMWENYADQSCGVCIAFDAKKMKSFYSKVASKLDLVTHTNYLEESKLDLKIENFFRTTIEAIVEHKSECGHIHALLEKSIDDDPDLFSLISLKLMQFISTTKSPDWCHEDEIRIFYPHLRTARIQDVKYKTASNGSIKPYIPMYFPKEIISGVLIGSKCDKLTENAIHMMLKTKGIPY